VTFLFFPFSFLLFSFADVAREIALLITHSRYYPTPKSGKAETLKGFVAFYKNKVDIRA